jgi:hypothetical protein
MTDKNDIFILDGHDKQALEVCLMELSDLFWDLFEQKRLAVVRPEQPPSIRLPMGRVTTPKRSEPEIPAY